MRGRRTVPSVATSLPAALCAYWIWALLAARDHLLVLERQVRLPPLGPDIPAGILFIAAPLAVLAALLGARFFVRGPIGAVAAAAVSIASIVNVLRCLALHDPFLSYASGGLAIAGTALIAKGRVGADRFRRAGTRAIKVFAAGALAAAAGLELVVMLFLVPWSLRGDLPGKLNNYPFGSALRSLLYADLAGYVRPACAPRKSLRGIRLEGANLRGAVLRGADLRDARLFRARLDSADLEGADLRSAHLGEARLSFVNLRDSDLSGANLSGVYSLGTDLRGAVLRGAGYHLQRFFYADARGADLTSAELNEAQFFWSDFRGAIFRNAKLPDATLIRTRLEGADLSGSTLTGADFCQAGLGGAILEGADLRGARRLRPDSLAEARTLRGAALDPPLLDEMKRRRPDLF